MEENSTRWLAVREASRRILVEENLVIQVPRDDVEIWHRMMLNMADSMPQRLEFPIIQEGTFSVSKNDNPLFIIHPDEPMNKDQLWLPFQTTRLVSDLIQMCSELLLAGYPGCSGCGYRDEEVEWDETAHRNRLKTIDE
ncbi:MAG: hypothetical protein ACPGQN_00610 [Candidatus Poseidoniaceae archaeon]